MSLPVCFPGWPGKKWSGAERAPGGPRPPIRNDRAIGTLSLACSSSSLFSPPREDLPDRDRPVGRAVDDHGALVGLAVLLARPVPPARGLAVDLDAETLEVDDPVVRDPGARISRQLQ